MPKSIHTSEFCSAVDRGQSPDADAIFRPVVKSGAARYSRERDLPRVLILWKHELDDHSLEGIAYIVSQLEQKAREARRVALSGHWAYDTNRHLALLTALEAERKALARAESERAFSRIAAE